MMSNPNIDIDVNELLDQMKERREELKERRPIGPVFEK